MKIQHCETCKEIGMGEYSVRIYFDRSFFFHKQNIMALTQLLRQPVFYCHSENFFVDKTNILLNIFLGMSDLIVDGHSSMLLLLVSEM